MTDARSDGPRRSRALLKVLVLLAAAAVLVFLFIRSAREVRGEPYSMPRGHLQGWTVALDTAARPAHAVLMLRPHPELVHDLFRQVFARAMESMNMSASAGIPLLLRGEYDRAFAGVVTLEALLAAAESAGLAASPISPVCMGQRRLSAPGSVQQLYFALFDAPDVVRFRESLAARLAGSAGAAFDPAAQSPILIVSTAGPAADWLPLRATREADCVAPILIE